MKYVIFLFAAALLFTVSDSMAKGGGHCVHGHAHIYPGYHHSHDTDIFTGIRNGIYSGYVLYGDEKISGTVICSGNAISVRQPGTTSTSVYHINDVKLRGAVLQNNEAELTLTKLPDNKLYRVLHTGTLNVYDDCFSFDRSTKQFFDAASWVSYSGHDEKLNRTFTTSVKRRLVSKMNDAYGLTITPKQYNKKELLAYLGTLN